MEKKINNEIIDTLILARNKFPGSSISLDALCKRYRIDNSKRTKHTALIDCDLLSKVYINLIDQKEPKLDFQSIEKSFDDNLIIKIFILKKLLKYLKDEKAKTTVLKKSIKKKLF